MKMADYVRNVVKQKLARGERLTGSDIHACAVHGVDLPSLERAALNPI